jgi:hypothetical protein
MVNDFQLLRLAAKLDQIASRVNRETELSRLVGRLARDPCDLDASAQALVYEAREGGILAPYLKTGPWLVLLQFALARVSNLCWEDMWDEAYPERLGQAWDGDCGDLLPVWRDKAYTFIEECHQEWLLMLDSLDEYRKVLIEAGASEGTVKELAEWFSDVRCA